MESYSVLIGGREALNKEKLNIRREALMFEAVEHLIKVQSLRFEQDVECQQRTLLQVREDKENRQDQSSTSEDTVKFFCSGKGEFACCKSDIRLHNGTHHINPTPEFRDKIYTKKVHGLQQHGITEKIYCKGCHQIWGGVVDGYPYMGLSNFKVEVDGVEGSWSYKKWKKVPGCKIEPLWAGDSGIWVKI